MSAWADQSGNGNNASQSDPSLAPSFGLDQPTGKPALVFDGTQKYLDVAASANLTLGIAASSFFTVWPAAPGSRSLQTHPPTR